MKAPRELTSHELKARLAQQGLLAAIAALNAAVPHRYTGVYRLRGDALHNVVLHDKQDEVRPQELAVVQLGDSFCQFVLRDGNFLVADSNQEARLDGHRFQGVVVSYHGVPVADNAGGLYGTLCHFDLIEHELPQGQFELLEAAGKMLFPYLRGLDGDTQPGA
ncbi:MAG: guanylate cyclase [Comamonadaceae bacterium]|nr:MAG: guanylate cyclase [Comamonadaceae bacterium]